MELNHTTFQFQDFWGRFFRGWIWIVIMGGIGAIIGFAISFILPPKYEAAASILVNLDYGMTEPLELVVEDRILDRVWHLIISDETYAQTIDELLTSQGENKAWASIEELRENTRLDARLSMWELIGLNSNPEIAVIIANAWRDVTLHRLDEAMDAAWNAQTIQDVMFNVACVEKLVVEKWDDVLNCVAFGPELSDESIKGLRQELAASHGILPIINHEPGQLATMPEHPVLWPRGIFILSGGMIGFIVGFIIVFFPQKTKSVNSSNNSGSNSISGVQHP